MRSLPPQLVGDRILLRRSDLSDAEAIHSWNIDPAVCRYVTWRSHSGRDDTLAYMQRCENDWQSGNGFTYLLAEKGLAGTALGSLSIRPLGTHVMVGYVIARDHWGQGYAAEALRMAVIVAWAHPYIERIWSFTHEDNRASCRVLEKCGFVFERVIPRFIVFPNIDADPRDVRLYARHRAP